MKKTIRRRLLPPDGQLQSSSLSFVLQRVYAARQVSSVGDLERNLNHLLPFDTLKGIDQAAGLLQQAIRDQKRIVIIADYDVDGATSCALALRVLRAFGARWVDYLVPNRFEYGYGLTPEIVALAKNKNAEMIMTVDNGIASCDGVAAAKALGMSVIITDHHLPGQELPAADAIVNPNQRGDTFASKALAGVGVVFYLMLALRSRLRADDWFIKNAIPEPTMSHFLDIVALGTVADVVPLDKNNRILVYQGLRRIRSGRCSAGISALLKVGKRNQQTIVSADLGFAVGPRLNAAGRLDDMSLGIECLLTNDEQAAMRMAEELDQLNVERRELEAGMQQQALNDLSELRLQDSQELPLGLCLYEETWHQGVIGILASRVKDRYHRPVICFAKADEHTIKGSARSIPFVHIRDVLETIANQCPNLIKKYGGHAMAAGLTISLEDFSQFKRCFAEAIGRIITRQHLQQEILSDGSLTENDLCIGLAEELREAGPWGQHFPEPVFDGEFSIVEQRLVGNKHLKLLLSLDNSSKLIDAIAFNIDVEKWPNHRCKRIQSAYRLDINEFRGARTVQLIVEYLEAC